jgi:hypothetical protein
MKKPREQEISLTKSKQLSLLQLPSIPYPGRILFISALATTHGAAAAAAAAGE